MYILALDCGAFLLILVALVAGVFMAFLEFNGVFMYGFLCHRRTSQ